MSEKQFRLSKKKKKWAKQFKPTSTARGVALNYPKGVEVKYTREIQRLINALVKATQSGVKDVFETPSAEEYYAEDANTRALPVVQGFGLDATFTDIANKSLDSLFGQLQAKTQIQAEKIAKEMALAANKSSRSSMAGSLKELSGGVTLQPSNLGGDIPEILQASIESNVGLITDITDSYLAKVSDAVNRSIMTGRGLEDLIPFMRDQTGVTKRHGKNVALDQTRKAYNSLNVARMENVGLSRFEWLHSGGSQKPRKYHQDPWPAGLNGGIFDIHDPPVIDQKTGEKGLPSHLINCKCRMIPVLVFDEGVPEA